MLPKKPRAPSKTRSISFLSSTQAKFKMPVPSLNNLYDRAEQSHKKGQMSFGGNGLAGHKPSIDRLNRCSIGQNSAKKSTSIQSRRLAKLVTHSAKKVFNRPRKNCTKPPNNIYVQYGTQINSPVKQEYDKKGNDELNDMFNNLCAARVQVNTLKTTLNNELFIVKQNVEAEKRQTVELLDGVIKTAERLKRDVLKNYEKKFAHTVGCFTKRVNVIAEHRALLDDYITSFKRIKVSNEEFTKLLEQVKMSNEICDYPSTNASCRQESYNSIAKLLQEASVPRLVKRPLPAVDAYNEYLTEISNRFNVSQTSTIPKKGTQMNLSYEMGNLFDANKTQCDARKLDINAVNDVFLRNNEVLNRIAHFSLNDLVDETESQVLNQDTSELPENGEEQQSRLLKDWDMHTGNIN